MLNSPYQLRHKCLLFWRLESPIGADDLHFQFFAFRRSFSILLIINLQKKRCRFTIRDVMSMIGKSLAHYQITAQIGKGVMGRSIRQRTIKLAIKGKR